MIVFFFEIKYPVVFFDSVRRRNCSTPRREGAVYPSVHLTFFSIKVKYSLALVAHNIRKLINVISKLVVTEPKQVWVDRLR